MLLVGQQLQFHVRIAGGVLLTSRGQSLALDHGNGKGVLFAPVSQFEHQLAQIVLVVLGRLTLGALDLLVVLQFGLVALVLYAHGDFDGG